MAIRSRRSKKEAKYLALKVATFVGHSYDKGEECVEDGEVGGSFGYVIILAFLSVYWHYPQRPYFQIMTFDCFGNARYPLGHNVTLPKLGCFTSRSAIMAVNSHLGRHHNYQCSSKLSHRELFSNESCFFFWHTML